MKIEDINIHMLITITSNARDSGNWLSSIRCTVGGNLWKYRNNISIWQGECNLNSSFECKTELIENMSDGISN